MARTRKKKLDDTNTASSVTPLQLENVLAQQPSTKEILPLSETVSNHESTNFDIGKLFPNVNLQNSNTIAQTLDMDALLGHVSIKKFIAGFSGDLDLRIDDSSTNQLPSDYIRADYKIQVKSSISNKKCKISLKKLSRIKLGVSNTPFGCLDIFLVATSDSINTSDLKVLVGDVIRKQVAEKGSMTGSYFFAKNEEKVKNKNSKKLEGDIIVTTVKLLSNDFKLTLKELYKVTKEYDPIIFFQTFGNKKSTITASLDISEIENRIFSVFSKTLIKNIEIDICLSTSIGKNLVTLTNSLFFEDLNIAPTHEPFFSSTVKNFYLKLCTNSTVKVAQTFLSKKLNFYTTAKYLFDFCNKSLYVFPLSLLTFLIKNQGFTIASCKTKFNTLIDNFKSIYNNQRKYCNGTRPYRMEVRCKLADSSKTLEQLIRFSDAKYFISYESNSFFKLLQINIDNFLDAIENFNNHITTPDSIVKSIIAEYLLKLKYLFGIKQPSVLPLRLVDYLNTLITNSDNHLKTIVNLKDIVQMIYQRMTNDEKHTLINDQIKYSSNLPEYKKILSKNITEVYYYPRYFRNHDQYIERLLNIYVKETLRDTNKTLDYLKQDPECEGFLDVKKFLKYTFLHNRLAGKATISKVMFGLFVENFTLSKDDLDYDCNFENAEKEKLFVIDLIFNKIIAFIKTFGIKNVISTSKATKGKRISIVQAENNTISIYNSNEKRDLLEVIKTVTIPVFYNKKTGSHFSELIRYTHGLFYYKHMASRFAIFHDNFAYSFRFRNIGWMFNRIRFLGRFFRTEEQFVEFINNIKEWRPSMFSYDDRIRYISSMGISFTQAQLDAYKRLVEIDVEEWNMSQVFEEIHEASPLEIFVAVVRDCKIYDNLTCNVERWSTNYINKYYNLDTENKSNSNKVNNDVDAIRFTTLNDAPPVENASLIGYNEDNNIVNELNPSVINSKVEFSNSNLQNPVIKLDPTLEYPINLINDHPDEAKGQICNVPSLFSDNTNDITAVPIISSINLDKNSVEDKTRGDSNSNCEFLKDPVQNSDNDTALMSNNYDYTNDADFFDNGLLDTNIDTYDNLEQNQISNTSELDQRNLEPSQVKIFENPSDPIQSRNINAFDNVYNEDLDNDSEKGSQIQVLSLNNSLNVDPLTANKDVPHIKVITKSNSHKVIKNKDTSDVIHNLSSKRIKLNNERVYTSQITDQFNKAVSLNSYKIGNYEFWTIKLYKKYRFKAFNSNKARFDSFFIEIRPKLNEWSEFLYNLKKLKVLSSFKHRKSIYYKFNLSSADQKYYLTFNYIQKFLEKYKNYPYFTASETRKMLGCKIRPIVSDWENYLDDLVYDKYLICQLRFPNRYRLG